MKSYKDIMVEINYDIDNVVRYRNEPLLRLKLRRMREKLLLCHLLKYERMDEDDLNILIEQGYIKKEDILYYV